MASQNPFHNNPSQPGHAPEILELRAAREKMLAEAEAHYSRMRDTGAPSIAPRDGLQTCLAERVASNYSQVNVCAQVLLRELLRGFLDERDCSLSENALRLHSGERVSNEEFAEALDILLHGGFIAGNHENLEQPSVATYRVTLKTLTELKLHPHLELPASGELVTVPWQKTAQDTWQVIIPPRANQDPDSFGPVYDAMQQPQGYCQTLGVIQANDTGLVVRADGRVEVFCYPWQTTVRSCMALRITVGSSVEDVRMIPGVLGRHDLFKAADSQAAILWRRNSGTLLRFDKGDVEAIPLPIESLPVNTYGIFPLQDGTFVIGLRCLHGGANAGVLAEPKLIFARLDQGHVEESEAIGLEELEAVLPESFREDGQHNYKVKAAYGTDDRCCLLLINDNFSDDDPSDVQPAALLLKEGPEVRVLTSFNQDRLGNAVFSPDGKWLAVTASVENGAGVNLISISPEGECNTFPLELPEYALPAYFAFSPNCMRFALNGYVPEKGCSVAIWDIALDRGPEKIFSFIRDRQSIPGACAFRSEESLIFIDRPEQGTVHRPDGVCVNELTLGVSSVQESSALSEGLFDSLSLPAANPSYSFPLSGIVRERQDVTFFAQMDSPVRSAVFTNADRIFYGCADGTVGELIRSPERHDLLSGGLLAELPDRVRELRLSPDQSKLLVLTSRGFALIDLNRSGSMEALSMQDASLLPEIVDFGPDGQTVVIAGAALPAFEPTDDSEAEHEKQLLQTLFRKDAGGFIEIHDAARLGTAESLLLRQKSAARFECGCITPSRTHLVYTTGKGEFHCMQLFTEIAGNFVPAILPNWQIFDPSLPVQTKRAACNPTSTAAIFGTKLFAMDAADSYHLRHVINLPVPPTARILRQAWSPCGNLLAVAWEDEDHQQPVVRIVAPAERDLWERPKIVAQIEPARHRYALCFSPDGGELLCGGEDGSIRVFGKD